MRKGRFIVGILLLLITAWLFSQLHQEYSKDNIAVCASGVAELMHASPIPCERYLLLVSSPFVLGIIGLVLLVYSRSNYYGGRSRKYY